MRTRCRAEHSFASECSAVQLCNTSPEIYDGTIVIKGCAREAGERTKIAVQSCDRYVDSVGACVGMRGMRVQSIIRELCGEKIDIVEYSDDSAVFATHALSQAKISRVSIIDPLGGSGANRKSLRLRQTIRLTERL